MSKQVTYLVGSHTIESVLHLSNKVSRQRVNQQTKRKKMQESGAKWQPFSNESKMERVGTSVPPGHDDFTSAEEYPYESTDQGGTNALLFPARPESQSCRLKL